MIQYRFHVTFYVRNELSVKEFETINTCVRTQFHNNHNMSVDYVYLSWIPRFFSCWGFPSVESFPFEVLACWGFLVEQGFRIGDTNSVIDADSQDIKILVGIPANPILEIFVKFFMCRLYPFAWAFSREKWFDCYPQSSCYFKLRFRGNFTMNQVKCFMKKTTKVSENHEYSRIFENDHFFGLLDVFYEFSNNPRNSAYVYYCGIKATILVIFWCISKW